ncbi:Crp/Fnr family transcriptional regulator [Xanthobacter sediminis]
MSALSDYILQRTELPPEEVEWLESIATRRFVPRGGAFCTVGQSEHEFGFVESGILQVSAPGADGRNILLDFVFPGGWALAVDAATRDLPSEVVFEAVTQCALKVWPYALREIASARHPGWKCLAMRMTEEAFQRKQHRYLSLRARTARERFADLRHELPVDWRTLPQHLLAAYLDITPQYLSRLKREAEETAAASGA